MPNLRDLVLAVGCSAILGASAGYAQARNDDAVQRWREQQQQAFQEWKERQEQTLEKWKEAQEERMKEERETWERQEQALKTWKEAQKERDQRMGVLREQDRQIRETLEKREKLQPLIVKKTTTYDTQKKTFADTITEKKSYASLLDNPELAGLFARYSNLKGTAALPAARISSNVTNPQTLDDLLEKINEAIAELPQNYAEVMKSTQVKVYVAATAEELSKKCNTKSAGGCYISKENTVCVSTEFSLETYEETMPHELSHLLYEKLPRAVKRKLTKTIKSIVARPEVKSDVIKDQEGDVVSWKDGLTLPRYAMVKPYGASNSDEFLATYVADIYGEGGRKVAVVLKGDYRQDAVKALEAMKEAGFLGMAEEAYVTIGKALERAGR